MKTTFETSRGSALLVSIFITGTLIIIMLGLLDHIVPLSRSVRGIENSTVAYYKASTQIESALATLSLKNPGHSINGTPNQNTIPQTISAFTGGYTISELTNSIPLPGDGTSDYDKNWNQISPGSPVQIFIPPSYGPTFLSQFQLDLRVPKLQEKTSTNVAVKVPSDSPGTTFFSNSPSIPVVFWTISDGKNTLIPSMNSLGVWPLSVVYDASAVNAKNDLWVNQLGAMRAKDTTGTWVIDTVSNLYTSKLTDCALSGCTLKLTVANVLRNQVGSVMPYLEYRIRRTKLYPGNELQYLGYNVDTVSDFGLTFPGNVLPSQYTTIDAEGFASGFKRTRTKKIQQLTTNEALDFTVYQ